MGKMASLDAEQREIPYEYLMWRRLAVIGAVVWVSGVVGVVTILILILGQ